MPSAAQPLHGGTVDPREREHRAGAGERRGGEALHEPVEVLVRRVAPDEDHPVDGCDRIDRAGHAELPYATGGFVVDRELQHLDAIGGQSEVGLQRSLRELGVGRHERRVARHPADVRAHQRRERA